MKHGFRFPASFSLVFCLVIILFSPAAAQPGWERLSGPTAPPAAEFIQHQGLWFMGTEHADQGDIFISDDQGLTWRDARMPNGGVATFLSHGERLFAGTYLDGVHYSDDNGTTWQKADGGTITFSTVEALLALEDGTLLAGIDPFFPSSLNRSLDGGQTWADIPDGPQMRWYDLIETGGVILACGEDQGVQRSTDSGVTWAAANVGLPAGADAHRFATRDGILYLAAESVFTSLAVYRSDDLGLSWQAIESNLPVQPGVDPTFLEFLAGDLYLATLGIVSGGGLYRSPDLGVTWELISASLPGEEGVRYATFMDGDLVAGNFDGTFRSSDGGTTWSDNWSGASGICGGQQALWTGSRLLVGNDQTALNSRGLQWTDDDGLTWTPASGPASSGLAFDFLQEGNTIHVAMYGFPRGVITSTDGGLSFGEPGSGLPSSSIVYSLVRHGNDLLAGTTEGLHVSSDDGASWQTRSSPGNIKKLISAGSSLYAGLYPGGVVHSVDGGLTWETINAGLVGEPHINDLEFFDGQLHAAVNVGVVMAWDGSRWQATGYPGESPNDILARENTLVAATSSGTFWKKTAGAPWEDFSAGFSQGIIEGLAATETHLVAVTRNRGFWVRNVADLTGGQSAVGDGPPLASRPLRAAPNPFNPRTRLFFSLDEGGAVCINIHDVAGRQVRTLLDENLAAGEHAVRWNGLDDSGRSCASGLYLARVVTPRGQGTAKLVLTR